MCTNQWGSTITTTTTTILSILHANVTTVVDGSCTSITCQSQSRTVNNVTADYRSITFTHRSHIVYRLGLGCGGQYYILQCINPSGAGYIIIVFICVHVCVCVSIYVHVLAPVCRVIGHYPPLITPCVHHETFHPPPRDQNTIFFHPTRRQLTRSENIYPASSRIEKHEHYWCLLWWSGLPWLVLPRGMRSDTIKALLWLTGTGSCT